MNTPVIFYSTPNFSVCHQIRFTEPHLVYQVGSRISFKLHILRRKVISVSEFFFSGVKRMRSGVGKRAKVILGDQSDGIT